MNLVFINLNFILNFIIIFIIPINNLVIIKILFIIIHFIINLVMELIITQDKYILVLEFVLISFIPTIIVLQLIIKLFVIPIVFLDNLGFNPRILKKIVMFIEKKYNNMSKGSKFVSQPITIPWEKFMKEPVFLKKDVFPVREYDFEGRKYFSYNNIEKILKEWYGDNCLKKWNSSEKKWEETLPVDKRKSKHVRDINLDGEQSTNFGKFRLSLFIRVVFYLALFFLLQFFFDDFISLVIILVVFLLSFIL